MIRKPHVYAAEGHAAGGLNFRVRQVGRSQHVYFYHEGYKKGRVSVVRMIVHPNGRYQIRPNVGHIRRIGKNVTMSDVAKADKPSEPLHGAVRGIKGVDAVVSKVRARRMMEDTERGSKNPGCPVYLKIFYKTERRGPREARSGVKYHLVRFKFFLPGEVDSFLADNV